MSWPPPPPPPSQQANNNGEGVQPWASEPPEIRRQNRIAQSSVSSPFPPPPFVAMKKARLPTESLASMTLRNQQSFPPPPADSQTSHHFQQPASVMPPPPPAPSTSRPFAPTAQPNHPPSRGLHSAPPSAIHPHCPPPPGPIHAQHLHPPPPPPPPHQYLQQRVPPPLPPTMHPSMSVSSTAQPPIHHPHVSNAPPPLPPSSHQVVGVPPLPTRPGAPPPAPVMNGHEAAPPRNRKIDPSKIPRPPLFTRPQDGDEPIPIYYPREALQHTDVRPPPDADSRFLTNDDGNAAPQLIRSTLYAIPRDRGVLRKSIPELGLMCTPMAIPSTDHVPRPRVLPDGSLDEEWRDAQRIPLIRNSALPPRCDKCHAYVNPFFTNKKCNFCLRYCNPSLSSQLTTQYGTVEYEVSGPYITRKTPVQPIYLYCLDATCPSLPNYLSLLASLGSDLHHQYQRQTTEQLAPRIGCCLVGSSGVIVAYPLRDTIGFSVMSDVTEQPFCPLPLEQWTFDVSMPQGLEYYEAFFGNLWNAWQPFLQQLETNSPYGPRAYELSCGGAALAFMADALSETGGRATLITWRRPNFGVGSIRDREQLNTQNYTKEKIEHTLYTPLQLQTGITDKSDHFTSSFYKQLGESCAKNRVCVDVILHTRPAPMAFLDLATLGELCRTTSGHLKWIRSRHWEEQLLQELRRPVLSFQGRDAVFKLRCSNGIQVKSYMSCTAPGVTIENAMADSPELEMSVIDPQSCISVVLEHRVGGIPKDANVVYFQSALLYTASSGKRRIRISTLGLRTTSEPADVFRSADNSAIMALLSRQCIAELWQAPAEADRPLQQARDGITSRCVNILSNYRLHTSAHSLPSGQLILPERLQLLPLFCMSALKSSMLRHSLPAQGSGVRAVKPNPTADERAFGLCIGSLTVPALAMLFVHANVFPILNLQDGDGEWKIPKYSMASSEMEKAACHAYIQLPRTVTPSIACLADSGVYLIDDGYTFFVYVGKYVPFFARKEILTEDEDGPLLSEDSDSGRKVHRLLWQLQTFCSVGEGSESTIRPLVGPVEVVIGEENHKDLLEERMMNSMVDDSSGGEHDYTEFLVSLHKKVRAVVEKGST